MPATRPASTRNREDIQEQCTWALEHYRDACAGTDRSIRAESVRRELQTIRRIRTKAEEPMSQGCAQILRGRLSAACSRLRSIASE